MLKKLGKLLLALVALLVVAVAGFCAYASATVAKRMSFPDTPTPKVTVSKDPDIIERGRYLVHGPAHCAQCHSTDDREHPEKIEGSPLSGGLQFAMGPIATRYAANLTSDPDTGLGKLSDEAVARTIRTGVQHNHELSIFMRYAVADLADEDLAAVLSYLRTLPPVKKQVPPGEVKLLGSVMVTMSSFTPRTTTPPKYVPAGAEPTAERGGYLAENVALCVGCHSKADMKTFLPTGPKAGGGNPDVSHGKDSDMEFVTPNLTSHATGYTGRVGEDEFIARIKSGRAIATSIMPWENFKTMTDSDLRSIYRFLKSLPPVENDVGPSYRKIGWKKP